MNEQMKETELGLHRTLSSLISDAAKAAAKNDIRCFSELSKKAREVAYFLGEDVYISSSLALESCLRSISTYAQIGASSYKSKIGEYSHVHTWVRNNKSLGFKQGYRLKSGRYPDFIFSKDGKDYPVECKKTFTRKSLNQLKTYMDEMNVSIGYAVAVKNNVDLPDGITFIEVPAIGMEVK